MKIWLKDHWLLASIIAFGAWLRMGGIGDFDFHHDEISALLRTQFSSFGELIAKGVAIDGHPAFTQLFLWVYTDWFGMSPWVVKLPFALAGAWSIYLGYAISKKLFHETSGIITATLLAVLQYGLIYSQWARPYSFGLLFDLIAFWGLVSFKKSNQSTHLIVFALATGLAAVTHYFALLQIILLTLFWWIFQSRKEKWYIFQASVLAALLFLPHWTITKQHLAIGGIGDWLAKPKPDFWWQVIQFTFHYHWLVPAILGLMIVLGVQVIPNKKEHWFGRIVLLLAAILPFTIAYYYSVNKSALLHFGTVYFSFPFFIMLITSFMGNPRKVLPFVVLMITLFARAQVWIGRQHGRLNQKTEYMRPFKWAAELNQDVPLLFDLRRDGIRMLAKQDVIDTSNLQFAWPLWEENELGAYINQLDQESLMVVATPSSKAEYLAQAIWKFPKVDQMLEFQSGAAYLLSVRGDSTCTRDLDTMFFDAQYPVLNDSNPYSHSLRTELLVHRGRNLWVGATYVADKRPEGSLVIRAMKGEEEVAYFSVELAHTYDPNASLQHTAWYAEGYDLELLGEVEYRVFLWVRNGSEIKPASIELRTFKGNYLKYGLFEPI